VADLAVTDCADLVAFLEARIDEERRLAEAAQRYSAGIWAASRGDGLYLHPDGPRISTGDDEHWHKSIKLGVWNCDDLDDDCETMRSAWMAQADHIARHDPARVLADIAAKRSLIVDYRIVVANNAIERRVSPDDEVRAAARDLIAKSLFMILRRLAAAYADHPDFRSEWRIDG